MSEQWTEKIKWQSELEIDAVSYNEWVFSLVPQAKEMVPGGWNGKQTTKIQLGDKVFHVRELPMYTVASGISYGLKQRMELKTMYGGKHGTVWFTDKVKIPMLTCSDEYVWMSLTPMEIFTQRPGLKKAKGRVLIGGLGMGWFARRVLERKQVTQVVVADINAEILEYFGAPLKEEFGDRLQLIHSNVYERDAGKYDSVLLDIWQNICDAKYDRKLKELVAWHPNVWAWGKGV